MTGKKIKIRLTKPSVKNLEPRASGEFVAWDSEVPQFGCRVRPHGKKTYIFHYRTRWGRLRKITLGDAAWVHPGEAREIARKMKVKVYAGGDPLRERKQMRRLKTFSEIAAEYDKRKITSMRSGAEERRIIQNELMPKFKNDRMAMITLNDIVVVLDRIEDRGSPTMRNRCRAVMNRLYEFAISRGYVEDNPVTKIEILKKAERSRARTLTDEEIAVFWHVCSEGRMTSLDVTVNAVRLILCTGARSGEVVGMTWNEVDLENGWWQIPGERSKNQKPRWLYLAPLARRLLEYDADLEEKRLKLSNKYVFPGAGYADNHLKVNSLSYAVRKNRDMLRRHGVADFCPHDLRRTAASLISSLGYDRFMVKKIIGHVDTSVTGTYDRYDYKAEIQEALTAYNRKLEEVVYGKKVVNDEPS
jgi:integrase